MDLTGLPEGTAYAEEEPKPKGRHHKDDGKPPPTGPPSVTEWQDFLGGIVLRLLTEGYLNLVLFREIDETELTDRERDLIRLSREDLHDMAAPMAQFSSKNKFARKHGRVIIAAAESYESLIDLLIWMRRVNKIAKKYRKPHTGETTERAEANGPVLAANGEAPNGIVSILNRGTG